MKKTIALLLLISVLFSLLPPIVPQAQAAPATAADAVWNVESDDDGTLSILAIGNSFSEDTLAYVWDIASDLGISDIVLGNLSAEDGALADHWANAYGDRVAYTYYTNSNGTWVATDDYKLSTALTSRNWDYIVLQQLSDDSGREETYNSDLTNLVGYVKGICPNAKLVWNMTWAYQENSEKLQNSVYDDQESMYRFIASAVMNKIATNPDFDLVIPVGSAAQNIRTSLIRDNICDVDGYHLKEALGRYLAGLTFVQAITGLDIWETVWAPDNVPYAWQVLSFEAASNAVDSPFAITYSLHDDVETSPLYAPMNVTDTETKSESSPSGDKAYARLYPYWTKSGYWYLKIGTNIFSGDDRSDCKDFWCTRKYSPTTLPVGSVIKLSSGWKYRAEAWDTNGNAPSKRPDDVYAAHTVVDDAFWKGYSNRAFNVSTTGEDDISGKTEQNLNNAFKLYYPVAKRQGDIHNPDKFVDVNVTFYDGYFFAQKELQDIHPRATQISLFQQSASPRQSCL